MSSRESKEGHKLCVARPYCQVVPRVCLLKMKGINKSRRLGQGPYCLCGLITSSSHRVRSMLSLRSSLTLSPFYLSNCVLLGKGTLSSRIPGTGVLGQGGLQRRGKYTLSLGHSHFLAGKDHGTGSMEYGCLNHMKPDFNSSSALG